MFLLATATGGHGDPRKQQQKRNQHVKCPFHRHVGWSGTLYRPTPCTPGLCRLGGISGDRRKMEPTESDYRWLLQRKTQKNTRKTGFFGCLRSEEHTSELQSRENLVCRL